MFKPWYAKQQNAIYKPTPTPCHGRQVRRNEENDFFFSNFFFDIRGIQQILHSQRHNTTIYNKIVHEMRWKHKFICGRASCALCILIYSHTHAHTVVCWTTKSLYTQKGKKERNKQKKCWNKWQKMLVRSLSENMNNEKSVRYIRMAYMYLLRTKNSSAIRNEVK